MYYDVFNGDADGICGLIQLRQAYPRDTTLITGPKREIDLLKKLSVQPKDEIVVLDISLAKNCQYVQRILDQGGQIFYVDHHDPGEMISHPNLKTIINTSADTCTSLLIDQYLQGRFRNWAITAAFGDNLEKSAIRLAELQNLNNEQVVLLKQLGIYINYNGYGSQIEDLHFAPDQLFLEMVQFNEPIDFIENNKTLFDQLASGYQNDFNLADRIKAEHCTESTALYILPDQPWARRISGVWANNLANKNPDKAHAILTSKNDGGFVVSVRAPINKKTGADELCSSFATGGGRKGAAGINHLPVESLEQFKTSFEKQYNS